MEIVGMFISYLFLGLSLAAPIGPINAAQLDRGMKRGFLHAWLIGLGSTLADIIYMSLVYMGMVHFIEIPFIKAFLWLFGFFVLLYTGIECLFNAVQMESKQRENKDTYLKTFMTGFLMALSNSITILFWLGIYGSILAKSASTLSTHQLIVCSSAIILGLLLWDITMAVICSSFRKILSPRVIRIISILSGITLVGFGVYFGLEACRLIFA